VIIDRRFAVCDYLYMRCWTDEGQPDESAALVMALVFHKLDLVRQFFETLKISIEPCIEVRQVPNDAEHVAVYATRHIAEGELLACIPKDVVLSTVNTAAADILRSSNLRGGLAVIFAVLYEMHVMGPRSQW
jgi:hypothetical protein